MVYNSYNALKNSEWCEFRENFKSFWELGIKMAQHLPKINKIPEK